MVDRAQAKKALLDWLGQKGYDCFSNISLGGKFPSIVALKDRNIVALEIKNRASDLTKAIGQSLYYRQQANTVYIALPSEEMSFVSPDTMKMLRTYGIGLMSVSSVSGSPTVELTVESKKTAKENAGLLAKIGAMEHAAKANGRSNGDIRGSIVSLLREHLEGMSVLDVSRHIGVSRQTVAKYIYGLMSDGTVRIRKVGTAKLCYLKRWGKKGD